MHWAEWTTGECTPIRDGEVHLWLSRRPDTNAPPVASGLSTGEVERCAMLRFGVDQSRCCARRGLLRRVLARYLCIEPAEVLIVARPGGRPGLAPGSNSDLQFSVSSSGDFVLVAMAAGMLVGVDVEVIHDLPELDRLVEHVLGTQEHSELQQTSPDRRTRWYLQRWTVKEAVLKGTGLGLQADPRQVGIAHGADGRVIAHLDGIQHDPSDWFVTEIDVAAHAVGALAAARQPAAIKCFRDEW